MLYYIYRIENLVNHKNYIGLTNNLNRRKNRHFADLKANRHDNNFLQSEYNQYGFENFSFYKEWEGDTDSFGISQKEQQYIEKYDSYKNGYNQNQGGNFRATNGGSKLIQKDILNILAVKEFLPKSGQALGEIFNITRTQIYRIAKGISFKDEYNMYHSMDEDIRKNLYNTFRQQHFDKLVKVNKKDKKRLLTKEQVFFILYHLEEKDLTQLDIIEKVGVKSTNTITSIVKWQTYLDYSQEFQTLPYALKKQYSVIA